MATSNPVGIIVSWLQCSSIKKSTKHPELPTTSTYPRQKLSSSASPFPLISIPHLIPFSHYGLSLLIITLFSALLLILLCFYLISSSFSGLPSPPFPFQFFCFLTNFCSFPSLLVKISYNYTVGINTFFSSYTTTLCDTHFIEGLILGIAKNEIFLCYTYVVLLR